MEMDERLKRAAETGNLDALYSFIHHDANVFKRIDKMEFVDTPLHVAAVAGNTGLIRVEGKEGFSDLHHVALDENYIHLLSRVLNTCPDCIFDLTVRRQTALHIAAESNNFEAFKAMLEWIQSAFEDNKSMRSKILNFQDKDSNTVLHLAASINHPQMIKLLIEYGEVDKNKINDRGFTAMDVLQRQTVADNTESVNILSSNPLTFQKLSKFKLMRDEIKEMRDKTMGVFVEAVACIATKNQQQQIGQKTSSSKLYNFSCYTVL
ncbi:hypothetical protein GOBAR_AA31334 [Gossypium barbadense]|uniref:Uncharacterized protein n=1 Tax=Gossypium barbadense TaxID=3634 RepID=A0A2P5WE33_GOSBA|nr:hypothetical protein GOBAR_AA31334 [Gossypium barbadense]